MPKKNILTYKSVYEHAHNIQVTHREIRNMIFIVYPSSEIQYIYDQKTLTFYNIL